MNKRIALALGIIVVSVALLVSVADAPTYVPESSDITATLTIDDVLPPTEVSVAEGTSALLLLQEVGSEMNIDIRTKEYAGLGTLVEGIASSTNGTNGNYWTYRVNDAFSQVGADTYIVKKGDLIHWSFEVPEE